MICYEYKCINRDCNIELEIDENIIDSIQDTNISICPKCQLKTFVKQIIVYDNKESNHD